MKTALSTISIAYFLIYLLILTSSPVQAQDATTQPATPQASTPQFKWPETLNYSFSEDFKLKWSGLGPVDKSVQELQLQVNGQAIEWKHINEMGFMGMGGSLGSVDYKIIMDCTPDTQAHFPRMIDSFMEIIKEERGKFTLYILTHHGLYEASDINLQLNLGPHKRWGDTKYKLKTYLTEIANNPAHFQGKGKLYPHLKKHINTEIYKIYLLSSHERLVNISPDEHSELMDQLQDVRKKRVGALEKNRHKYSERHLKRIIHYFNFTLEYLSFDDRPHVAAAAMAPDSPLKSIDHSPATLNIQNLGTQIQQRRTELLDYIELARKEYGSYEKSILDSHQKEKIWKVGYLLKTLEDEDISRRNPKAWTNAYIWMLNQDATDLRALLLRKSLQPPLKAVSHESYQMLDTYMARYLYTGKDPITYDDQSYGGYHQALSMEPRVNFVQRPLSLDQALWYSRFGMAGRSQEYQILNQREFKGYSKPFEMPHGPLKGPTNESLFAMTLLFSAKSNPPFPKKTYLWLDLAVDNAIPADPWIRELVAQGLVESGYYGHPEKWMSQSLWKLLEQDIASGQFNKDKLNKVLDAAVALRWLDLFDNPISFGLLTTNHKYDHWVASSLQRFHQSGHYHMQIPAEGIHQFQKLPPTLVLAADQLLKMDKDILQKLGRTLVSHNSQLMIFDTLREAHFAQLNIMLPELKEVTQLNEKFPIHMTSKR